MDFLSKNLIVRSTIIGTILDVILGFSKIFVGIVYHSHALVLDGIHSFTDVLTDFFVIFISKFSNQKPDDDHPYGHEKIETIGTLTLGSVLMVTSGALLFEIVQRMLVNQGVTISKNVVELIPGNLTIIVAICSIVVKELLYRYRIKIGQQINSQLLIANAWHSRSDALSSIAVLIGLIFSKFGYHIFDLIAGLVVVIMIGKIGWDFIKASVIELIETSLDQDVIHKIGEVILNSEGVKDFHNLRSRKVGNNAFVDVNVQVSPIITVSEGHEIASWVVKNIKNGVPAIEDVTVHIDIENDLKVPYRSDTQNLLPLRTEVISTIKNLYNNELFYNKITRWNINYSKGKISLDLYFNQKDMQDLEISENQLKEKCNSLKYLSEISYYYADDRDDPDDQNS